MLPRLLCLAACVAALGFTLLMASDFYWSASPQVAGGEHILFGRVLPEPLGRLLWAGIKPALLLLVGGVAWSAYLVVKAWRAEPEAGLCPRCGYDLRASPERCPECGATANRHATPGL